MRYLDIFLSLPESKKVFRWQMFLKSSIFIYFVLYAIKYLLLLTCIKKYIYILCLELNILQ